MAQKELDIPVDGMHCSSCSLLVEKSLGKLEEVDSINVDLNTNKAHIVLNDKISPDIIDKTVESVGFTVPKDEVVIQIDGMHCASCVNNVERFLPRVDGVVEANANLSNQKVTIKYYRDMLNLKEIQKTIEMLGFEYLGLDGELDVMDEEERYQKDLRGKLYRIIVGLVFAAIFCKLSTEIALLHLALGLFNLLPFRVLDGGAALETLQNPEPIRLWLCAGIWVVMLFALVLHSSRNPLLYLMLLYLAVSEWMHKKLPTVP